MPDEPPSIFDDASETPSPHESISWRPSALIERYGGFKLGIMVVLAGHIVGVLILITLFSIPDSGMGMNPMGSLKDLFMMLMFAVGITFALGQWLYVVPLIIVGLVLGFANKQWRLLLGVLTAAAMSFILAFPICGSTMIFGI